eukprot:scaffold1343_cov217-Pinguiococcus_pyrenoidosus.AAC.1
MPSAGTRSRSSGSSSRRAPRPSRLSVVILVLSLASQRCLAGLGNGLGSGADTGVPPNGRGGESAFRRLWESAQEAVRSADLQNMREGLAQGVRLQQTDDFEGVAHIGIRSDRFARGTSETTENAERVRAEGEMRRSHSAAEGIKSWLDYFPRIRYHFEPSTTLKLRKRFYPLKTR